jgi:hypothetical protein
MEFFREFSYGVSSREHEGIPMFTSHLNPDLGREV